MPWFVFARRSQPNADIETTARSIARQVVGQLDPHVTARLDAMSTAEARGYLRTATRRTVAASASRSRIASTCDAGDLIARVHELLVTVREESLAAVDDRRRRDAA